MVASLDPSRLTEALCEAHAIRPVETPVSFSDSIMDLCARGSLPRPVPVTDLGRTRPFAEVVQKRFSHREIGSLPLPVDKLGLIIARSGLTRAHSTDPSGAYVAHRSAPSAGGRHPVSLVTLCRGVEGLADGAWVLDPERAVLRPAKYSRASIDSATMSAMEATHLDSPPPAIVFLVAHPNRTLSRYPKGLSLLWREVGALAMLVHLAASDVNVGSCIAGTCAVLHEIPDSDRAPVDMGAVVLTGTIGRASNAPLGTPAD